MKKIVEVDEDLVHAYAKRERLFAKRSRAYAEWKLAKYKQELIFVAWASGQSDDLESAEAALKRSKAELALIEDALERVQEELKNAEAK